MFILHGLKLEATRWQLGLACRAAIFFFFAVYLQSHSMNKAKEEVLVVQVSDSYCCLVNVQVFTMLLQEGKAAIYVSVRLLLLFFTLKHLQTPSHFFLKQQ